MKSDDIQPFAQTWACAWEQVGRSITPGAIELAFESLRDYEIHEIRRALTLHMKDPQRGRFAPTVADVIAVLKPVDHSGHPGLDEAWGICVRSFDEYDTVVVTDEIMKARESCQPIMDLGDEVGARMTFRETYQRLIDAARYCGKSPRWWVSNGTDRDIREQRIREAVDMGRLGRSALDLLPRSSPTITETIKALSHVAVTDRDRMDRAEDAKSRLASLRDMMLTRQVREDEEARSARESKRLQAEQRRKDVVEAAERKLAVKADGTTG